MFCYIISKININMNTISDIITNLKSIKFIDIKKLPTQGYFYPKDFTLSITKASSDDILLYNFNYIKDDMGVILQETKRIIKNNIILSKGYQYEDLKSNDLLFIFFEIVKFTMNREILIPFDDIIGRVSYVSFSTDNFNYFNYKSMKCEYDEESREFIKYGYKFSLPSIGAENCLVEYVFHFLENEDYYDKNDTKEFDYSFDFLFLLGNKNYLTKEEMDNLVIIFNEDLDEIEQSKISDIVKIIYPSIGYTLKAGNKTISLNMKVDFEKLFI